MIDMGQADRTLRMRPISQQSTMCWTVALKKAAAELGFDHYINVPTEQDEELRSLAHKIRGTPIHPQSTESDHPVGWFSHNFGAGFGLI